MAAQELARAKIDAPGEVAVGAVAGGAVRGIQPRASLQPHGIERRLLRTRRGNKSRERRADQRHDRHAPSNVHNALSVQQILRAHETPVRLCGGPGRGDRRRIVIGLDPIQIGGGSEQPLGRVDLELAWKQLHQRRCHLEPHADGTHGVAIGHDDENALAFLVRQLA